MRTRPTLFFALLIGLFLSAACTPAVQTATPSPTNTPSPGPTLVAEPAPTSTLSLPTNTQTITDPMLLVLPTAGTEPVSVWRPPSYPIPWALSPHDHFYFTRPIAADEVNWPLPNYRYGGIFFGENIVHTGVDIAASSGIPVLAAGQGTVVWAGWGLLWSDRNDPYGMAVMIRHDFGYQGQALYTVYAHLSEIDVVAGQWLDTGDPLGKVGDTGLTTGPHLHFEVRVGMENFFATQNPELWLAPPQGWGVLAARILTTAGRRLNKLPVYVSSETLDQKWVVWTYGPTTVNSDPYYDENMVISDLPAGLYTVSVPYYGRFFDTEIQILPGQVTFFIFQGYKGFTLAPLPTPSLDEILTPTP